MFGKWISSYIGHLLLGDEVESIDGGGPETGIDEVDGQHDDLHLLFGVHRQWGVMTSGECEEGREKRGGQGLGGGRRRGRGRVQGWGGNSLRYCDLAKRCYGVGKLGLARWIVTLGSCGCG